MNKDKLFVLNCEKGLIYSGFDVIIRDLRESMSDRSHIAWKIENKLFAHKMEVFLKVSQIILHEQMAPITHKG